MRKISRTRVKCTHRVHEEPVFCNRFGIEEEFGAYNSLRQEITSKSGNPFENGESCPCLQYEECNDLLQEEADDDCWPDGEN